MGKKKKEEPSFPNRVFVVREKDGEDSYLLIYESVEEMAENGQVVAVYELTGTGKVQIAKTLVDAE